MAPYSVQLHQAEPAYKYLLQAFSTVVRACWDRPEVAGANVFYFDRLQKAITLMTQKRMQHPNQSLMPCIQMLTMSELIRTGRLEDALPHISSALSILKEWEQTNRNVAGPTAAYKRFLLACHQAYSEILLSANDDPSSESPPVVKPFTTFQRATNSLENTIIYWVLALAREPAKSWITPVTPSYVTNMLRAWSLKFQPLYDQPITSDSDRQMAQFLRMHYLVARVVAACVPDHTEMAFLHEEERFLQITDDLESLLEEGIAKKDDESQIRGQRLGLIPPAFFVATRCRHRVIRKRALDLLRNMDVTEGVWNSSIAYEIAHACVSVESKENKYGLPGGFSATVYDRPCMKPDNVLCQLDHPKGIATIKLKYWDVSCILRQSCSVEMQLCDKKEYEACRHINWPLDATLKSWGYLQSNLEMGLYLNTYDSLTDRFLEVD